MAITLRAGKGSALTHSEMDANFNEIDLKANSTDMTTALVLKANLASPALTGTPTAPTAVTGTNTTQVATTEFVKANIQTKLAPDGYSIITDNGIIKNQCTAWVILDATSSTILDSFNISSIVVVGSGYYYVDITFATPMDNMNYVVVGTANPNYGNGWSMPTFHDFRSSTTSKVRVGTSYQNSGILAETLSILIFGGKN